jgi:hypothetical protein
VVQHVWTSETRERFFSFFPKRRLKALAKKKGRRIEKWVLRWY